MLLSISLESYMEKIFYLNVKFTRTQSREVVVNVILKFRPTAQVIGRKYNSKVRALKRLVAGYPPRRPWFKPGSSHLGFIVDKVALGQVFSEYFGFPCQFSFHQFLHIHSHISSGTGTIGQ
jgi:hypothetical protein